MNRISKLLVGLGSLGLLLTACVPLDAAPTRTSAPDAMSDPHGVPPSPSPSPNLPLQPYVAAGLDERIAALRSSSDAYQVLHGKHPVDTAVPGTEEVLLAERFSSSSRFELPETQSGDMIHMQLACSKNVATRIATFDVAGNRLGSGFSSGCPADEHSSFAHGASADQRARQIRVVFETESDVELSVLTFKHVPMD